MSGIANARLRANAPARRSMSEQKTKKPEEMILLISWLSGF
jgi:hypothetical protein